VSEVLGEIVWLMSQSPIHKQFYISDLEWFVMTPVLLQQFRIFYAQDRPVGVLLWAFASNKVEAPRAGRDAAQAAGLEIWRQAVGGGSHRALRRLRGDDQGPQGERVCFARGAVRRHDGRREEGSQGSVMGTWFLEVLTDRFGTAVSHRRTWLWTGRGVRAK
jgi:hypothetical protein